MILICNSIDILSLRDRGKNTSLPEISCLYGNQRTFFTGFDRYLVGTDVINFGCGLNYRQTFIDEIKEIIAYY